MDNLEKNRLSKVLASAGVASRRACEELIFDGRVTVNGEVVKVPQTLVSLREDEIFVDGKAIAAEKKVYFALNKPKGYLCSNVRHSKRARLVIDLFKDEEKRLFTVGRLDKETEGLILVTNDGHFAQKLIHPSRGIAKEYVVKTHRDLTPQFLKKIADGTFVEGVFVKPSKVEKVRKNTVKITVMEGKKHEVRLLVDSAGLEVLSLKRIRIGHIQLGGLPTGEYRPLSRAEIEGVL